MARICDLTGKRTVSGHTISHSNRKTKRKFYPNLHVKKFYIEEEDRWIELKVSSAALRTVTKKGLMNYVRSLSKKGKL